MDSGELTLTYLMLSICREHMQTTETDSVGGWEASIPIIPKALDRNCTAC